MKTYPCSDPDFAVHMFVWLTCLPSPSMVNGMGTIITGPGNALGEDTAKTQQLEERVHDLETTLSASHAELETTKSELVQSQTAAAKASADLVAKEEAMVELEEKTTLLGQELEKAQNRYIQLEDIHAATQTSLAAERDELTRELTALRETLKESQSLESLNETATEEALRAENERLQALVEALTKSKEESFTRGEDTLKIEEELAQLSEENNALKVTVSELADAKDTALAELAQSRQATQDHQKRLEAALAATESQGEQEDTTQAQETAAELAQMRAQYEQVLKEKTTLSDDLEQTRSQVQSLEEQLVALKREQSEVCASNTDGPD